jgi:hypothetical protein
MVWLQAINFQVFVTVPSGTATVLSGIGKHGKSNGFKCGEFGGHPVDLADSTAVSGDTLKGKAIWM